MSILNVLLSPDRLLIAADTLTEDSANGLHSMGSNLLLIPHHNAALATRGPVDLFLDVYDLCLQKSYRSHFSISSLAREIGPMMDDLWPKHAKTADKVGRQVNQMRTKIVLGGWSRSERRMVATAYSKQSTATPTLVQPLIDSFASPRAPLRGSEQSFDPASVFGASVLQARYVNMKHGRQVAGGSILVAQLRERESRINEWDFVQPELTWPSSRPR